MRQPAIQYMVETCELNLIDSLATAIGAQNPFAVPAFDGKGVFVDANALVLLGNRSANQQPSRLNSPGQAVTLKLTRRADQVRNHNGSKK